MSPKPGGHLHTASRDSASSSLMTSDNMATMSAATLRSTGIPPQPQFDTPSTSTTSSMIPPNPTSSGPHAGGGRHHRQVSTAAGFGRQSPDPASAGMTHLSVGAGVSHNSASVGAGGSRGGANQRSATQLLESARIHHRRELGSFLKVVLVSKLLHIQDVHDVACFLFEETSTSELKLSGHSLTVAPDFPSVMMDFIRTAVDLSLIHI